MVVFNIHLWIQNHPPVSRKSRNSLKPDIKQCQTNGLSVPCFRAQTPSLPCNIVFTKESRKLFAAWCREDCVESMPRAQRSPDMEEVATYPESGATFVSKYCIFLACENVDNEKKQNIFISSCIIQSELVVKSISPDQSCYVSGRIHRVFAPLTHGMLFLLLYRIKLCGLDTRWHEAPRTWCLLERQSRWFLLPVLVAQFVAERSLPSVRCSGWCGCGDVEGGI